MNKGKIYLIPNVIAPGTEQGHLSTIIPLTVRKLTYFVVENVRTARRLISKINQAFLKEAPVQIGSLKFEVLDKHTPLAEIESLLEPVLAGLDCGVISESGCPAVADPGSELVRLAHERNIQVLPLPGPSSIVMALMASGMNGQSFSFHGYLPIKRPELVRKIREIEQSAHKNKMTQIFIETPHRNQQLFNSLVETCNRDTDLCVAMNLSSKKEFISTAAIKVWAGRSVSFEKVPAVFLLATD